MTQKIELARSSLKQTERIILFKLDYYTFLTKSFAADISGIGALKSEEQGIFDKILADSSIRSAVNKIVSYDNDVCGSRIYTNSPNAIFNNIYTYSVDYLSSDDITMSDSSNKLMKLKALADSNSMNFVVPFTRAIYSGENNKYHTYITLHFKLDQLFSSKSYKDQDEYLFVLDKDNNFLFADDTKLIGKKPAGNINSYFQQRFDTRKYVFINDKMNQYGLNLFLVKSFSSLFTDMKGLRNLSYMISLFSMFLSVIITYFVVRRFSNRMNLLLHYMEHIGRGDFSYTLHVKGSDEIGQTVKTLKTMSISIQTLIKTNEDNIKQNKDIELRFIYAQLNTHFLYNTLSTMNWITIRNHDYDLSELILSLSNFYKLSLNKGMEMTTLEREVNTVKNFVNIHQYTNMDQLNIVYDISPTLNQCPIIKLIIQPLVENSIIHGIYEKCSPGTVVVKCFQETEYIHICVIDDGMGMSCYRAKNIWERQDSSLSILQRRIKFYYGANYDISVASRPGIGTAIELKIPSNL